MAIGVALLIGAVVLGSLLLSHAAFVLVLMAATGLAVAETAHALRFRSISASPWMLGIVAGLLPGIAFVFGGAALPWAGLGALVLAALWQIIAHGIRRQSPWPAVGWSTVLIVYIAMSLSTVALLIAHEGGVEWLICALIVVVCNDTGAYASGVLFGRHPMAPRISPKKTWEGQAGALVSTAVAGVLSVWLIAGMPWWVGLIVGPLLMVTATAGDLAESSVKRWLGIKDMSRWIPGHGGFMDRLDAIIPSMPMAFLLLLLFATLAA
nr:phosphatidate cytidylyltransferase [Pseudoclavibacter sp. 13-3]